jgi:integrase
MSVPSALRGLPGLSPEQRQRYPQQATEYLRWLSWQDRRPDATSLDAYMQREKRNGASAEELTDAREALSFLHDIVLRIPTRAPATPVQDAVWRDADMAAVLARLNGTHRLMARMIFEAKLTPAEAAYVRVGDLQLQTTMGTPGTVIVRDSAGRCDRAVAIPPELADALRVQRARVRTLYRDDREAGHGVAPLPPDVNAHFPVSGDGWEWQFLFPHDQRRLDEQTGREVRDTVGPDHVLATMRAVLHAETRILPVARTSPA